MAKQKFNPFLDKSAKIINYDGAGMPYENSFEWMYHTKKNYSWKKKALIILYILLLFFILIFLPWFLS